MKSNSERRAKLLANPNDRKHGTITGYQYGCRCERCMAAQRIYAAQRRQMLKDRLKSHKKPPKTFSDEELVQTREKPKRHLKTAKNRSDVCTVDELQKPMMGKPSVKAGYCLVCGRTEPLEQHHVVFRSAGTWVRDGVELKKPTLTLCGFGNNLYDDHGRMLCHGAAHHRLLHFRFVQGGDPLTGHWEYLFTNEPTKYETALDLDGWRRLGGNND